MESGFFQESRRLLWNLSKSSSVASNKSKFGLEVIKRNTALWYENTLMGLEVTRQRLYSLSQFGFSSSSSKMTWSIISVGTAP